MKIQKFSDFLSPEKMESGSCMQIISNSSRSEGCCYQGQGNQGSQGRACWVQKSWDWGREESFNTMSLNLKKKIPPKSGSPKRSSVVKNLLRTFHPRNPSPGLKTPQTSYFFQLKIVKMKNKSVSFALILQQRQQEPHTHFTRPE